MPTFSHQIVYRSLTEALLERGHKITLITTLPSENEKTHENVTLIDVSIAGEKFQKYANEYRSVKSFTFILDSFINLARDQIELENVQKLIKSDKKFDLLIVEHFGLTPLFAFGEHFKIPVIGFYSSDTVAAVHARMGNEGNAISHPDRTLPMRTAKTFFERLTSCIFNLFAEYFCTTYMAKALDEITKQNFPLNKKFHYELLDSFDMLFINVNPILGYHRPILSNTIELGFLHIKPPKKLPEDLEKILNTADDGVIYFSLGSLVKTDRLDFGTIERFLEAFSMINQTVLWKFDGDIKNLQIPKNVILRKWFPQSDLLAHPNLKLFITQGGQQSIEESITREVPLLILPFQVDHKVNGVRAEERGIGKILEVSPKLTSTIIKNSIHEILNNGSYKSNVKLLKRLVEDAPMTPREKACWYVEYVIRHGGAKFLHYEQKEIPFYQYHYYDVVCFIFAVVFIILVTFMKCLKRLCKKLKLKSE